VAERVVDRLELVDVDEQDREQRLLPGSRGRPGSLQTIEKQTPVGQLGECVVERRVRLGVRDFGEQLGDADRPVPAVLEADDEVVVPVIFAPVQRGLRRIENGGSRGQHERLRPRHDADRMPGVDRPAKAEPAGQLREEPGPAHAHRVLRLPGAHDHRRQRRVVEEDALELEHTGRG